MKHLDMIRLAALPCIVLALGCWTGPVNAASQNLPPTLSQPANMTVIEGATADQTLNATDSDGNALAFSLASGPTYAFVTTTSPGAGTATGNLHLAPGLTTRDRRPLRSW
jgi:hypothetical protein